jgi:hypothetical protein
VCVCVCVTRARAYVDDDELDALLTVCVDGVRAM